MKAIVLAAGRGERMRPLTDSMPKPLLKVGGRALLDYHLDALQATGVSGIVINMAWLSPLIRAHVADRQGYKVPIELSDEGEVALETGGGIFRALPLLGDEPFWVVNGDVYADYVFPQVNMTASTLAHLLLVPNPPHNPGGDFCLRDGRVSNSGGSLLTYSGIALLRPELFAGCSDGIFSLTPLLRAAADAGQVTGEQLQGDWHDVGTPARLEALNRHLV